MDKKKKSNKKKYTVSEIKELILRDSPEIEYGRYNITAPKIVMDMVKEEFKEPRSKVLTNITISMLEKINNEKRKKDLLDDILMFEDVSKDILSEYDYEQIPWKLQKDMFI